MTSCTTARGRVAHVPIALDDDRAHDWLVGPLPHRPSGAGVRVIVMRTLLARPDRSSEHELDDARLHSRKEERAADARRDRRSARVAWIRAVRVSLLPFTDAGAGRAPIARR